MSERGIYCVCEREKEEDGVCVRKKGGHLACMCVRERKIRCGWERERER